MSKFRTVKISNPKYETNNLRHITLKSSNLKGRGDICVFVPPDVNENQELPVVILLHGVYGSAWSWPYNSGVHMQAMEMIKEGKIPPMIIAMPSDGLWGDGSGYLPHNGYNFEKWIIEDVLEVLYETIGNAGKNSPLFISGLSMGGFGALRMGSKYGHIFKGFSGHSSITNLVQMKLFVEEGLENYVQDDKTNEDVFDTIRKNVHSIPPFRFDCGTSDLLIEHNRELHRKLEENGINHIYEEFSGAHEWPYWEKHISKSLLIFSRQL
jgi:putative tributyrin esterase